VRFAHHLRHDHGPALAVVGHFDAIERRPAHILALVGLLAAGIDVDADDLAAGRQLDSERLHRERLDALGEVAGFRIAIDHRFHRGALARLHVGGEFPLAAALEALARHTERRDLAGEFGQRPVV
jgi:hypothetical protein